MDRRFRYKGPEPSVGRRRGGFEAAFASARERGRTVGKSQRLTVQEVASACEVRPVTVLLWIRAGLLQAKKARGRWWIDREDLDAFRSRGVPR